MTMYINVKILYNGFLIAVFCHNMMNMVAKELVFGEWRLDIGTTQLFFLMNILSGFPAF